MLFDLFRQIRQNIREDGLIVGSSGFLVREIADKIDFSQRLRILEVGSGKGAITEEIIRRMSDDSELDICEIKSAYNPWIESMIAANPRKKIRLHNCCVVELLTEAEKYDVILSSLPLKDFERAGGRNGFLYRVIRALRFGLKEGGLYLQYQYFRSNKADIEAVFGKEMDAVNFVPWNILPAFVYRMTK